MKSTFNRKLLIHFLSSLCREIDSRGLRLVDEQGKTIAKCGHADRTDPAFAFSSYKLHVGKDAASISTDERNAIRSAGDLLSILIQDIREADPVIAEASSRPLLGQVRASHLVRSFLILVKSYENRFSLVSHYEKILSLSGDILEADNHDHVLEIIISTIGGALQAEGASLILTDPRTDELYFHTITGSQKSRIKKIKIPPGQGIAGSVVRSATPELITKVSEDKRFYSDVDRTTGQQTRDLMAAPIFARERVIGVVEVVNSKNELGFNADDLEFLTLVSRHIGLLIENARNKEDLNQSRLDLDQRLVELNSLYEIIESMDKSPTLEDFRNRLLRSLLKHLKFEKGSLLFPDEQMTNLTEVGGLVYRMGEIDSDTTNFYYKNVKDIIIWLTENHEPYMFTGMSERRATSGLAKRFYEENPEMANSGPGIWIPVIDAETKRLSYIISLVNSIGSSGARAVDLIFHRSLTSLAASIERKFHHRAGEKQNDSDRQKIAPPAPSLAGRTIQSVERMILLSIPGDSLTEEAKQLLETDGERIVNPDDTLREVYRYDVGSTTKARKVVDTALAIKQKLKELSDSIIVHAGPLHTNPDNTNYTNGENALADIQKIASSAKIFEVDILITDICLDELQDKEVPTRELEQFRSKEGQKPVTLYELLDTDSDILKFHDQWDMALDSYRKMDFFRASILFSGLKSGLSQDVPASVYMDRCSDLISSPPSPIWNHFLKWTGESGYFDDVSESKTDKGEEEGKAS